MITLLIGENSFEIEQKLGQIMTEFDGTPEKFDGVDLEPKQLPDLLMGLSLFSEQRLVIVRELGANKQIWDTLPQWLERMNNDIHLVLVEPKPDKRTKSWKALQKAADVHEFKLWAEHDDRVAEAWVRKQADKQGVSLANGAARLLVARVGVNQWQLAHALDKLSVYDEITETIVQDSTEARLQENVFMLFETALKGNQVRVQEMVTTLSLSEDPYQLFGLLSGQAFQLAALVAARDGDDVAKDFGVHPFVLSKLRPYARERGVKGARQIVVAFAGADEMMKTSSIEPWVAIERALMATAINV